MQRQCNHTKENKNIKSCLKTQHSEPLLGLTFNTLWQVLLSIYRSRLTVDYLNLIHCFCTVVCRLCSIVTIPGLQELCGIIINQYIVTFQLCFFFDCSI